MKWAFSYKTKCIKYNYKIYHFCVVIYGLRQTGDADLCIVMLT